MSLIDAILIVLSQSSTPLTAKQIWKRIEQANMFQSNGKTPDATVSARIYEIIKTSGEASPFIKVGKGLFAINPNFDPNVPFGSKTKSKKKPKSKNPPSPQLIVKDEEIAPRKMKIIDAAYLVLSQAKKPLTAPEIWSLIDAAKLVHTEGKTPDATVNAAIYVDIKRKGNESRFVKVSKGVFAINPNAPKTSAPETKPVEVQPTINDKESENIESSQKTDTKPKQKTKTKKLSFIECALKVLRTYPSTEPVHYQTITEIAIANQWLKSTGKTPHQSMFGALITNVHKDPNSPFEHHKGGFFSLTKPLEKDLRTKIKEHNLKTREQLLAKLQSLSGKEFEKFLEMMLPIIGFTAVERTQYSKDHGIDLKGVFNMNDLIEVNMVVQAKCLSTSKVGPAVVQQLRGAINDREEYGLLITTTSFTSQAKAEANDKFKSTIHLIDGEKLIDLMMQHKVGVSINPATLYDYDENALNKFIKINDEEQ